MRRVVFLIFLGLFCINSQAFWKTVRITASVGNPIPSSFDHLDPQSLIATGLTGGTAHMGVNQTGSAAVLNCQTADTTSPPADVSDKNVYFPSIDPAALAFDSAPHQSVCYLRGDGGAVTAGTFELYIWGRR